MCGQKAIIPNSLLSMVLCKEICSGKNKTCSTFCAEFHQNQWDPCGNNSTLLPDQQPKEKKKQGIIR